MERLEPTDELIEGLLLAYNDAKALESKLRQRHRKSKEYLEAVQHRRQLASMLHEVLSSPV